MLRKLAAISGLIWLSVGCPDFPAHLLVEGDQAIDLSVDVSDGDDLPNLDQTMVRPDVDPALLPFGPARPVSAINSDLSEDDPSLTGDMLELYFNRGGDVWVTKRQSIYDAWAPPQRVDELTSQSADTAPKVVVDGLTIYITSARSHANAKGGQDIYVAKRPHRDAAWGPPSPVEELNSVEHDCCVALADRLLVFFSSNRSGDGDYDLYTATRSSVDAPFDLPTAVSEINTAAFDGGPWIDTTGCQLYFASERSNGAGALDLWFTSRDKPSAAFGLPIMLGELNTPAAESDPWVSPDLQTIYFSSTRSGEVDIFVATRDPAN